MLERAKDALNVSAQPTSWFGPTWTYTGSGEKGGEPGIGGNLEGEKGSGQVGATRGLDVKPVAGLRGGEAVRFTFTCWPKKKKNSSDSR